MRIILYFLFFIATTTFADSPFERVEVITKKLDGSVEKTYKKLEKQADGAYRFQIPIAKLTSDIDYIDIVGDFAKAKKGEEGYFVLPPNAIGSFVCDNGNLKNRKMPLPIFGMKNPRNCFVAIVKGLRFEFSTIVDVKDGNYLQFPRFHIKEIEFDPYEDLIVDFYELKGNDANYSGMGRTYRKYQLDRGEVKPIKERIKTSPSLKYTTESIFVRLTQGSKSRETRYPYQTAENASKVRVNVSFDKVMQKMREFHKLGMRKVEVCFVAWNIEGFEGRLPDLFPPDPAFGGEEKMREAIALGKSLGYQMTNHVCNWIASRSAKRYSDDIVVKTQKGNLMRYPIYRIPSGISYVPCFKVVHDKFIDEDYKGMRDLGFNCGTHHIDVTSARPPFVCHDPRHPCTRKDTAEYQNKIGEKCKEYFGGFSSEAGYDHVARTMDFALYTNTFFRHKCNPKMRPNHPLLDDRTIPLWQIIYHGIILSNSDWETIDLYYDRGKPEFATWRRLQFWEYGGRPVFYWKKAEPVEEVVKIYNEYQPMVYLQYEFMDFHGEIAPEVFITQYSDGSEVITNYTKQPFSYKGETVPAEDYKLFKVKK